MLYLLDANVFIQAKNQYYGFDICPGFWSWMDSVLDNGDVFSIDMVRQELAKGDDDLADWAKERSKNPAFLKTEDGPTQQALEQVANYVATAGYKPQALQKFLAGADPWLIAKAMALPQTAKVVTHERLSLNSVSRVPIPNVCREHTVEYCDTFDLLRRLSAKFVLEPA